MQQCKGHSGYPVTHFWRHHEDKVFFLGKGHHDHPKPELKLSAEKKRTYIRVSIQPPSLFHFYYLVHMLVLINSMLVKSCFAMVGD